MISISYKNLMVLVLRIDPGATLILGKLPLKTPALQKRNLVDKSKKIIKIHHQ